MWKECKAMEQDIIALRRALHQIPELSLDLPETLSFISAQLDAWGIPHHLSPGKAGIIGEFDGGREGKTILLRADVDGLPIQEETGLPFSSRHEGRMHACGHDAHGAMLLGALKVLFDRREQLAGRVRFIFQTGEEAVGGARIAVKEGIMEGVDGVFGCHIGCILSPDIPSGTVISAPGPVMAAPDRIVYTVRGQGCHGSSPEKGVDPVTIASHIVIALQEILAREIPASAVAVHTIGSIHGGVTYNVIPDTVVMEGTLRTVDPALRQQMLDRMCAVARLTAETYRGHCEVELDLGPGPVINDPGMASLAADAAADVLGETWVRRRVEAPNMGGEDFSRYLAEKPGAFFFLSTADRDKGTCVPHHNCRFDIDEDQLWKGSAVFVRLTERFLSGC